jgi:hypothetical protein
MSRAPKASKRIGDNTPAETPKPKRGNKASLAPAWEPGKSANPAGRPRGSRSKLSESFLRDVCAEWEKNGIEALQKVRETDPSTFIRVIASLVPKEVTGENGGPLKLQLIKGDDSL